MRNLQNSDNIFFEEYKRLDKLCSDMYSCQNGVSEYIFQMDNVYNSGLSYISSWSFDYKNLKHIRFLRNQIAHDPDIYQISKPEDLNFVKNFYSRIISGDDPLTLLRASKSQKKAVSYNTKTVDYKPAKQKSNAWLFFAIVLLMLAIIYFIALRQ